MAIPVADEISQDEVDEEWGSRIDALQFRTPETLAQAAVFHGGVIVTGIPRPIDRARSRVLELGDPTITRSREIPIDVTDATDIDGNPISLPTLWVGDLSERVTLGSTSIRYTAIDESVAASPFGILVASTGRVVLILVPWPDGKQEIAQVLPMDGDEIIVQWDRTGELAGAPRSPFVELRVAYDEKLSEVESAESN